MPKAIEIYVEALTGSLMVDVNTPMRTPTFRFGWDAPSEIWEAMNDTVPGIICGRVRLVKADDTPIMSVEDGTDGAIMDGLSGIAESQRKSIAQNSFIAALQEIRSKASEIFGVSVATQGIIEEQSGWKG